MGERISPSERSISGTPSREAKDRVLGRVTGKVEGTRTGSGRGRCLVRRRPSVPSYVWFVNGWVLAPPGSPSLRTRLPAPAKRRGGRERR
jgi:hypothetical protein